MKVIILALFASLAIGGVFGDEKANAIDEINNKYSELFRTAHHIAKELDEEMKKRDPQNLEETKAHGETLKSNTLTQFADEVKKTSRTAIVRGKPLSTFECLANVAMEGRNQILGIYEDFVEEVDDVVQKRESRVENLAETVGLILNSVTELKDQAIKNINDAKTGIKELKEEALKRLETGRKHLLNLERVIGKPTLKDEYLAIKQSSETKFKEAKEALFRKLQKCL